MIFGKQTRYCPNCGARHYDATLSMTHVLTMCCNQQCRDEWQMKYARMILGRDGPEPEKVNVG